MAKKKKFSSQHQVFHGKEPSWEGVIIEEADYGSAVSSGLNYYSTISQKDKRKYFVKWAKAQGKSTEEIAGVPTDYLFSLSSQARMLERGFVFNEHDTNVMLQKLDMLIQTHEKEIVKVDPAKEAMKAFAKEQAIDQLIGKIFDIYDSVIDAQQSDNKQLKAPVVNCDRLNVGQLKEVVDYYNKQLIELKLVYNKADPELMEGYAGVPRIQIKRLMLLHVNVVDELTKQQMLSQAKKPRKTRSPKVKTAQQLTAKVKYLKSYQDYDIMSIDISKLIGCTVAYIFNTKNRKLQYYYSETGITVKGSTLQNFSKEKSSQKTIRKPKEFLSDLNSQPRVRSEKLFESVNAKASALTGRINEHCIILKVY